MFLENGEKGEEGCFYGPAAAPGGKRGRMP
jgi:hypothetical protein